MFSCCISCLDQYNSHMDTDKFLQIERDFHDNYSKSLNWDAPVSPMFSYGSDRDIKIEQYFKSLLGDISGKKVLDIGSGHGNCALNLALMGAEVTSIDLSPDLIAGCRHRAKVNNLKVEFMEMDACNLSFSNNYFDVVVGFRTIHHLPSIKKFYEEAYRVLKHGGSLIFVEPQKYNPFVEFGRRFIKNKETDRTPTEHPLVPSDLRDINIKFGRFQKREYDFLSVGVMAFKDIFKMPFLYRALYPIFTLVDSVLRFIPPLRPLYWQVVVKATKI